MPKKQYVKSESVSSKPKYKNKKVLLTPGGVLLEPKHLQDLKGMGVIPDGITFDSIAEAEYYRDILVPKIQKGEIEVELQPKFILLDKFEKPVGSGKWHQAITYSPDFLIRYVSSPDGRTEAIDVKGYANDRFSIKKKMFDEKYRDIPLIVIKKVLKYGGFITEETYLKMKKLEKNSPPKNTK